MIISLSEPTELVDSVCMHHLHVVDADLAPLPRGNECAPSTPCESKQEQEQQEIKIPTGTFISKTG